MPSYDQNPPIFFDSGLTYDADPVPAPALRKARMNKVRRNWASQSPADCIASLKPIVEKNAANADIPAPNAPYTEFATAFTAFVADNDRVLDLETQLKAARDKRDASKETAVIKANTFASHAEAVTGADVAKLHAAGFEIAGAPGFKPAAAAAQALNLVLTIGDNDGELDAHWDAVPNARLYQLQTSANPTDATLWKDYGVPQSRSSIVLSGLQSGVKIWVRVRSLGAGEHPAGPWSDPAVRSVP